jgi:hypothetical protein
VQAGPASPGGGQCAESKSCTPGRDWGRPRERPNPPQKGNGKGSGGTSTGTPGASIAGADRQIELVREGKKQLFLATVTADSPICQAPGMAGECNSMRNAVTDGYDPYQAWVQLACGTGGGGLGHQHHLPERTRLPMELR